ncbi:MAG: UDP-3-O-[3-hydroxymyristoyl] N-acetylglucosamine deacetylase [Rickettsiaceae bacterium]|nr:MAG: UDP-3-O-[3-hydroxymyristoyl] N-acetylglucosamine deacetylase [Rickettsiaceae bacterium]
MQVTIEHIVSCYGIGVHSGRITHLTLKPAKINTGIMFVRKDIATQTNFIQANYKNVIESSLCTGIRNESKIQVLTIEHLMAALWGCGIDNIIVELDNEEVPIMDGSSKPFVFMIEYAGKKIQNAPKRLLKIVKSIRVAHMDSEIIAEPYDDFKVDLTIEFAHKLIGKQNFTLADTKSFKEEVAAARTFGFLHELDYLQSKGKALGASLENSIGIDEDIIMNPEGLRCQKEFVKHKLLDLAGDFYTAGSSMLGSFVGHKTSHVLNNYFLHQIFSNPANYQWVSSSER